MDASILVLSLLSVISTSFVAGQLSTLTAATGLAPNATATTSTVTLAPVPATNLPGFGLSNTHQSSKTIADDQKIGTSNTCSASVVSSTTTLTIPVNNTLISTVTIFRRSEPISISQSSKTTTDVKELSISDSCPVSLVLFTTTVVLPGIVAPFTLTKIISGSEPSNIQTTPETPTAAVKTNTWDSPSVVGIRTLGATVGPFTLETAAATEAISSIITPSPKDTSPPEIATKTRLAASRISDPNSPAAAGPTPGPNSVRPLSSPPLASFLTLFKPGRDQTESGKQVPTTQTPGVVQDEQPPADPSVKASSLAAAPPLAIITLGTNTFAPVFSSVYVINSQTLAPGAPAITASNSIISLEKSGSQLVVAPKDSLTKGQPATLATTIQLLSDPSPTPPSALNLAASSAPVIATIGNSPITITPSASFIVFTPSTGSPVTILPGSSAISLPGGTIVSLSPANPTLSSPAAPVLIIDNPGASSPQSVTFPTLVPTSTSPLPLSPTPPPNPITVIGPSNLPIVLSNSEVIVDGVTLSPGGPAAIVSHGIPISLGASESVLVTGSSTVTIAETATGIGADIYSGLGGAATTGARTGIVTSVVSGSRNESSSPPATTHSILPNNQSFKSVMPLATGMTVLLSMALGFSFLLR